MLVCDHCGGLFNPEDFNTTGNDSLIDQKAESLNEIYGTDSKEFMDCYVYICSSCGGEIIVNGTEASTQCVYCGSSAVVFSRIAKQKRPRGIIPFKITREEAIEAVREQFNKGFFIPKAIKEFKPNDIRGIYIPYWLVNCYHFFMLITLLISSFSSFWDRKYYQDYQSLFSWLHSVDLHTHS